MGIQANRLYLIFLVTILTLAVFTSAALALTVNDIANSLQNIFQPSQTQATTGGFNLFQWLQSVFAPTSCECSGPGDCDPGYSCSGSPCGTCKPTSTGTSGNSCPTPSRSCTTSQNCPGTQTCSNGIWSSCADIPNDNCPASTNPTGPTGTGPTGTSANTCASHWGTCLGYNGCVNAGGVCGGVYDCTVGCCCIVKTQTTPTAGAICGKNGCEQGETAANCPADCLYTCTQAADACIDRAGTHSNSCTVKWSCQGSLCISSSFSCNTYCTGLGYASGTCSANNCQCQTGTTSPGRPTCDPNCGSPATSQGCSGSGGVICGWGFYYCGKTNACYTGGTQSFCISDCGGNVGSGCAGNNQDCSQKSCCNGYTCNPATNQCRPITSCASSGGSCTNGRNNCEIQCGMSNLQISSYDETTKYDDCGTYAGCCKCGSKVQCTAANEATVCAGYKQGKCGEGKCVGGVCQTVPTDSDCPSGKCQSNFYCTTTGGSGDLCVMQYSGKCLSSCTTGISYQVDCPQGTVCCITDKCQGVICKPGYTCEPSTGKCNLNNPSSCQYSTFTACVNSGCFDKGSSCPSVQGSTSCYNCVCNENYRKNDCTSCLAGVFKPDPNQKGAPCISNGASGTCNENGQCVTGNAGGACTSPATQGCLVCNAQGKWSQDDTKCKAGTCQPDGSCSSATSTGTSTETGTTSSDCSSCISSGRQFCAYNGKCEGVGGICITGWISSSNDCPQKSSSPCTGYFTATDCGKTCKPDENCIPVSDTLFGPQCYACYSPSQSSCNPDSGSYGSNDCKGQCTSDQDCVISGSGGCYKCADKPPNPCTGYFTATDCGGKCTSKENCVAVKDNFLGPTCYGCAAKQYSIVTGEGKLDSPFTIGIHTPVDNIMSIFAGKPVPNGIYVDGSPYVTFTPVDKGVMTIITFFIPSFTSEKQMAISVNRVTVS